MKSLFIILICAACMVAFVSNMATVENDNASLTHRQNVPSDSESSTGIMDDDTPPEQLFQSRIYLDGTDQIRYKKWNERTYLATDAYFVINFAYFDINDDGGFGGLSWHSNNGDKMAVYTQDGIIEYVDILDAEGLPIKRYYASKP